MSRAKKEVMHKSAASPKKWIQDAIKHPGALHASLHIPEGKKIPEKRLESAMHSNSPLTRKRAALAKTLKGFHH